MKPALLFITILLIATSSSAQDTSRTFTIVFPINKIALTKEIRSTLDTVARTIKERSIYCNITGCSYGENEKRNIAAWNRMNNMVSYLVNKKSVNSDRIIFSYNTFCPGDGFNISFTNENDRTNTPPPHPDLRKKKSN
jgi:OOP family OmpA-OmpF porin